MLQELTSNMPDIRPGPSSQTTVRWPLSIRVGQEERLVSGIIGLDGGNLVIQPPMEKTWEEVVEEVLHNRAGLWDRLADL